MQPASRKLEVRYDPAAITDKYLVELFEYMSREFKLHTFHINGFEVKSAKEILLISDIKKVYFTASEIKNYNGKEELDGQDVFVWFNLAVDSAGVGIWEKDDKSSLAFMQIAQNALERCNSVLFTKHFYYLDYEKKYREDYKEASNADSNKKISKNVSAQPGASTDWPDSVMRTA